MPHGCLILEAKLVLMSNSEPYSELINIPAKPMDDPIEVERLGIFNLADQRLR